GGWPARPTPAECRRSGTPLSRSSACFAAVGAAGDLLSSCSDCAGARIAEVAGFSRFSQSRAVTFADGRQGSPLVPSSPSPLAPPPWEGPALRLWAALILASTLLAASAPDCSAQLFGGKKAKVTPQQRVPELIGILKMDKDARKRSDAAEELRQYDLKEFP